MNVVETSESYKTESFDISESNKINNSVWLYDGIEYVAAMNCEPCEKLPAGTYSVYYSSGKFHVTPNKLNTDELYEFKNSTSDVIINETINFWNKRDIYKENNILHKRGILLEGVPGNSKTSTINMIINNLLKKYDILVFYIRNLSNLDVFIDFCIGTLSKIESNRNIITVIEDIDRFFDSGNNKLLLSFLDGEHSLNHNLTLMTSNDTSELPSSVLRPSRIDLRFRLDNPTTEMRREYLKYKGIQEPDLDTIVEKTEDFTFSQLKDVFINVMILGKDIDTSVSKIKNPLDTIDYLSQENKFGI